MQCELCGLEDNSVRARDDCNGQPRLVCDACWDNLEFLGVIPDA